jgi:dTDP-glucose 4,6-dehydratase
VEWYLENQDWVDGVIAGEYLKYYKWIYGTG